MEIEGRATPVVPVRKEGEPTIGDRVMHEKFGLGTVRRVDHDKLEVSFDKKGVLKVMAGFVKMV
jgi:DNA helicase-2/ATP-dependent DNA helicase PcrA